jgi:hypothetical protein
MTLPEGSNFMVFIILWCVLLPEGHLLKAGSFRPFDRLCFEIHRPVSSCAGLNCTWIWGRKVLLVVKLESGVSFVVV